jgi:hypothetical protein
VRPPVFAGNLSPPRAQGGSAGCPDYGAARFWLSTDEDNADDGEQRYYAGMPTTRIRSRGRLPHWESVCGIYFVTFRLAGSLPPSVVASLQSKLAGKAEGARKKSRETERYLDVGAGVCHLKRPEVADLVAIR